MQVSPNLAAILTKMVKQSFPERYASAVEALQALDQLQSGYTPTVQVASQAYTSTDVVTPPNNLPSQFSTEPVKNSNTTLTQQITSHQNKRGSGISNNLMIAGATVLSLLTAGGISYFNATRPQPQPSPTIVATPSSPTSSPTITQPNSSPTTSSNPSPKPSSPIVATASSTPPSTPTQSETSSQREAEAKAAQQREAEAKAAQQREAEAKAAQQREAETKAAQQREAEAKAAQQREAEAKAAQQREAEAKAAQQREAEAKAAQQREAEAKAAEAQRQYDEAQRQYAEARRQDGMNRCIESLKASNTNPFKRRSSASIESECRARFGL
ncbi:MAG: hypothetical protein IM542_16585 [Pseudanabaena sp. M165S2SP1A06QC]|nr:hypothetical protein [Pseudanabaena sp. M165S2SP1A06QC]